jgi:hypothetical protein
LACPQRDPKRVYGAAYARLVGDHGALRAVGLPRIVDLREAHTIFRIAYVVMRVENQAAGVADGGAADTWTGDSRWPRRRSALYGARRF